MAHFLWDLSHIQPRHDVAMAGETIPAMFWNAVQARGDAVWLRQKELGIWRAWNWNQVGQAVREIAHGLLSMGFAPGECASILSNTVVEWVLSDLAVLSCGGVCNGIYPTDAASQVHYLCEDSRTTVLFVEDDEQLDKALEVRERLPLLRKIVVFDMEGSTYTTLLSVREGALCPGLESTNACYVGFEASRSFLDRVLPAGTYWVIVDGFNAMSSGAFTLRLSVGTPAENCGNFRDDELDADRLERELTALLADPAHLAAMASAMRQGASVDAAERVAAVVEQAARG